ILRWKFCFLNFAGAAGIFCKPRARGSRSSLPFSLLFTKEWAKRHDLDFDLDLDLDFYSNLEIIS
ncbi:hypothetical protein, partial [Shewanella sp. 10N.286.51.B7]|uniref:hypothetical protein n=1 Tax=Shewanella sp. 10N.286.51.B7 TaxID=1880836 RepID=UPI001A7E1982